MGLFSTIFLKHFWFGITNQLIRIWYWVMLKLYTQFDRVQCLDLQYLTSARFTCSLNMRIMILIATRMIFLPIPMQILQIYVFCNHRIVKKKKIQVVWKQLYESQHCLSQEFPTKAIFSTSENLEKSGSSYKKVLLSNLKDANASLRVNPRRSMSYLPCLRFRDCPDINYLVLPLKNLKRLCFTSF